MSLNSFVKTLRAQRLGQQLRHLREQRGMTLKEVALHIGRDLSALGRYERGLWPIQRADVAALLDLYGFHSAPERAELLSLAEEVWKINRWSEDFGDLVDASFISFPWLEERADVVCSYHSVLVPGIFQTREYAERVIRAAEGTRATDELVQRGVDLRVERQLILDDQYGTKIDTVIDEAALRRWVGGADLMQRQLARIAELARRHHITVRVLPAKAATHVGVDHSFWIFRMPHPYPEVGYLENLAGHLYVEMPKAAKFVDAYACVRAVALDERESMQMISAIAEDLHERSTAAGGLAHQH